MLVAEKKGSLVARLLRRTAPGAPRRASRAKSLAAIEDRAAFARYGL